MLFGKQFINPDMSCQRKIHDGVLIIIRFRASGQGVFDSEKRRQTNGLQARNLRVQQLHGSMYGYNICILYTQYIIIQKYNIVYES